MPQPSTLRLNLLRAGCLLLALGMGSQIWPELLNHPLPWEIMHGVAATMLGALTALSLIGLRYPLQMLPLLFFELCWKAIWLTAIALPQWLGRAIDAAVADTAGECLVGVVFLAVIPWDYVWRAYVRRPGDRWGLASRRRAAPAQP
jgi:hypothetical protein